MDIARITVVIFLCEATSDAQVDSTARVRLVEMLLCHLNQYNFCYQVINNSQNEMAKCWARLILCRSPLCCQNSILSEYCCMKRCTWTAVTFRCESNIQIGRGFQYCDERKTALLRVPFSHRRGLLLLTHFCKVQRNFL